MAWPGATDAWEPGQGAHDAGLYCQTIESQSPSNQRRVLKGSGLALALKDIILPPLRTARAPCVDSGKRELNICGLGVRQ